MRASIQCCYTAYVHAMAEKEGINWVVLVRWRLVDVQGLEERHKINMWASLATQNWWDFIISDYCSFHCWILVVSASMTKPTAAKSHKFRFDSNVFLDYWRFDPILNILIEFHGATTVEVTRKHLFRVDADSRTWKVVERRVQDENRNILKFD